MPYNIKNGKAGKTKEYQVYIYNIIGVAVVLASSCLKSSSGPEAPNDPVLIKCLMSVQCVLTLNIPLCCSCIDPNWDNDSLQNIP